MNRESLNWTGSGVAFLLIVLLGYALRALVSEDIRPTNHDILLVIITFLTTKIGTIIDWFYGGSSTAKKQADAIATLATNASIDTVTLQPGQQATATATSSGTTIHKENSP